MGSVVTRRVGQRLSVAGTSTARVFFGPFEVGEELHALTVLFHNAAPTAGDQLVMQIKAFAFRPANTALEFAANGRSLTGDDLSASEPRLPVGAFAVEVPVGFVATSEERFIGVEVTEAAGDDTDGSIWAWCGSRR